MTAIEVANMVAQAVEVAIVAMAHHIVVSIAQDHPGPSAWKEYEKSSGKDILQNFQGELM